MCGISGYISSKKLLNENGIDNTIQLMRRRGPDSNNYHKENFGTKLDTVPSSGRNLYSMYSSN